MPLAYFKRMEIIETPIFTKIVESLLTDEEYRLLQSQLVGFPEYGKLIPGSGGLRKIRWRTGTGGKRGGVRVIYYWYVTQYTILRLYAYPKGKQDDLTSQQLKTLKKLIEKV